MNICVSCDNTIAKYLSVLFTSICVNNKSSEIHFYVLNSGIDKDVRDEITHYVNRYSHYVFFIDIDSSEYDFIPPTQWPNACYFWIAAAEYLPEHVDRALFLDVDILINGSLEFYNVDFMDKAVAVFRRDYAAMNEVREFDIDKDRRIGGLMNSAIVLLNVKKMRELNIGVALMKAVIDDIITHYSPVKYPWKSKYDTYYVGGDEGLASVIFGGKILYLSPEKYNIIHSDLIKYISYFNEPRIIHYHGNALKPWKVTSSYFEAYRKQNSYFYSYLIKVYTLYKNYALNAGFIDSEWVRVIEDAEKAVYVNNHRINYERFLIEQLSFFIENKDPDYFPALFRNSHGEETLRSLERFISIWLSLSDEKSALLCEKILAARLSTLFLDLQHYMSLRPMYTSIEWDVFTKKAETYRLKGDNYSDRIQCWGIEAYSYHGNDVNCGVEQNDIVIDIGAFTGNTAMYFSKKTGKGGHVFAFEATPKTADILKKNLETKQVYNVTIVPMAVSDKEETLRFPEDSKNDNKSIFNGGIEVPATTLDLWAERNKIKCIDFIKMDIEGAEMSAIEGAKNIIREFTPKMALSIYHKPDDFYRIADKVLSINPNYKLYLNHGSLAINETCMFFSPSAVQCVLPFVPTLTHIKKLYQATLNALAEKANSHLFDRITDILHSKHGLMGIPIQSFPALNKSRITIPFAQNSNNYYGIIVRNNIFVELHFADVQNDKKQTRATAFLNELEIKHPSIKIFRNTSEMGCYFCIPRVKNAEMLQFNIHKYEPIFEQIADYLQIFIADTLPFLLENGFASGEHLYFWRNVLKKFIS